MKRVNAPEPHAPTTDTDEAIKSCARIAPPIVVIKHEEKTLLSAEKDPVFFFLFFFFFCAILFRSLLPKSFFSRSLFFFKILPLD